MQKKRLHIALFTVWFPTEEEPLYGIFVLKQAQLIARECDITVFVVRRALVPASETYQIGAVTVRVEKGPYLPNTSTKRLSKYARFFEKSFLRRHAEKPIDLIHSHDYVALYAGHMVAQKTAVPHVCTMHNTDFLLGKVSAWRAEYIAEAFEACSTVIAVGQELKRALRHYSDTATIEVIANLIDDTVFGPGRPRSPLPFRFLFVGYFDEKKNVLLILQAFHRLAMADTTLTLIGQGGQLENMKTYINNYGLGSQVTLIPTVANEELPQYYQSHHCYVSASTVETFGITVLEAMACGMHIIYSSEGEVKNIVPTDGAVAVSALDIDTLADTMREMVRYYDENRSEAIRQHFTDRYSSKKVLSDILRTYHTAVYP